MSFRAGAQELFARVRTGVRAGVAGFGRDRRGIAAIEFALIAPILLAAFWRTTFAGLDKEPYDYEGFIATHIDTLLRGISAGDKA